jgi:hypothetical protein
MSVLYHVLSPQSRGLFHGAIAQSGVATSSLLKLDKNPIYYARCQVFFCKVLIAAQKGIKNEFFEEKIEGN